MRKACALAALLLCAVPGCGKHDADDGFVANVKHLAPSVVLLTMQVPGEDEGNKVDDAYATGIVVASGTWGSDVVTVQHAIEGAWNLHVTVNNKERIAAKVVAKDTGLDVALVRIARKRIAPAVLGSQSDAQPGRAIGLLGYPIPDQFDDEGLGLATSLNEGRISSFRHDAIEVTLPIVPGESGSPIFLADNGEIVGMAESRFDEEHSIGFALPADDIKKFLHKNDVAHGF